MEWTIEYIESGDFFRVSNEGVYEAGDSVRLYQSIFSNRHWKPGASILMDTRRIDFRNVNYRIMSESSHNLSIHELPIGNSNICYVAQSPTGYGICRQFQMLMDGKISTKIEVFNDEEKAVDWLTRKTV